MVARTAQPCAADASGSGVTFKIGGVRSGSDRTYVHPQFATVSADSLVMAFMRSIRAAVRALLSGADEARSDVAADRRERWVERGVAAAFVACAAAMAVAFDYAPADLPTLAWFVGLAVVLL